MYSNPLLVIGSIFPNLCLSLLGASVKQKLFILTFQFYQPLLLRVSVFTTFGPLHGSTCCVLINFIQLTLELHKYTYMAIFFKSKYDNT